MNMIPEPAGLEPNIPLLRKTLEHIEAHPEEWKQETWRCATGMCFAGWAVTIADRQWAADKNSSFGSFVVADENDRNAMGTENIYKSEPGVLHPGIERIVNCDDAAIRELGISEDDADVLFDSDNDLHSLKLYVAEIEQHGRIISAPEDVPCGCGAPGCDA